MKIRKSIIGLISLLLFITFSWMETVAGDFTVPIWHPDALWEVPAVTDVGSGAIGKLDGPRLEIMSGWAIPNATIISPPAAGPFGFLTYDSLLDRIHLVGGSGARGNLDGPFSRARIASHSYSVVRKVAINDRYAYFTEPENKIDYKSPIRVMDFVTQTVRTLPLLVNLAGMTLDSVGRLFVKSKYDSNLFIISPNGDQDTMKLDMVESAGGFSGMALAYDENTNHLYASSYGSKLWYVYYWDLADGSFHGVLPNGPDSLKRGRNVPGPFIGIDLYNQMELSFGADDPEKRFLYIYPNDTKHIFRLDLTNEIIWASSKETDGMKFISSGSPKKFDGWSMRFNQIGDLVTDIPYWDMGRMVVYKRIN